MAAKAATVNARKVAETVSKKLGKPVNQKRVRQWVRDHLPAFDDDGYTQHLYTPAQVTAIVNGMTGAASKPRAKTAAATRAAKPKPTPATPTEA